MEPYLPLEIAMVSDDELHRGFFSACRRHQLTIQRCDSCSTFQHPPRVLCSKCRSSGLTWSPVSGRGSVYTYTVVYHGVGPLARYVPYNVASIELEGAGGARLVSNVVDVEPAILAVGLRVEVVWDDMAPEVTIPRFRVYNLS